MINEKKEFNKLPLFNSLIKDYLSDSIDQLDLPNYPNLSSFDKPPITNLDRELLSLTIKNQYNNISIDKKTIENLTLLKQSNSYTVTTGHQLCLMTGPMYFINKICSTIALTEKLKVEYPDRNFIPIFWLASEDHDFEEVNHFNLFGKTHTWNNFSKGAVGKMSTDGITNILEEVKLNSNLNTRAEEFLDLAIKAYKEPKLVDATRVLVNEIFKGTGLVIIDGDDSVLKQKMIPYFKRELIEQITFNKVSETNKELATKKYKIQVNPREINLFYLENNSRNRIIEKEESYTVLNSTKQFSEEEILIELNDFPEKFSPNVLLRPLYQEVVLPNIAYIGGGGEISYWLQLQAMFDEFEVNYPKLLVRDSAVFITKKTASVKSKQNLTWSDLFKSIDDLSKTIAKNENTVDFEKLEQDLEHYYNEITTLLDKSLHQAVDIEKNKSIKGLRNIENRNLKSIKLRNDVLIKQIQKAKSQLFPQDKLQERFSNYLELLATFDEGLIPLMITNMNPLEKSFHFFIED